MSITADSAPTHQAVYPQQLLLPATRKPRKHPVCFYLQPLSLPSSLTPLHLTTTSSHLLSTGSFTSLCLLPFHTLSFPTPFLLLGRKKCKERPGHLAQHELPVLPHLARHWKEQPVSLQEKHQHKVFGGEGGRGRGRLARREGRREEGGRGVVELFHHFECSNEIFKLLESLFPDKQCRTLITVRRVDT